MNKLNYQCHFRSQILTGQFFAGTTTRLYACHSCQEKLIHVEVTNQYWTKYNQAFYETNAGWETIGQTLQQAQQESAEKQKLWEQIKLQYPQLAQEIDYHHIKGECSLSGSIICEKI